MHSEETLIRNSGYFMVSSRVGGVPPWHSRRWPPWVPSPRKRSQAAADGPAAKYVPQWGSRRGGLAIHFHLRESH